jgi:LacI family repressor for deo operon, udp, cdd, tsx, nupC, and nupG
MFFIELTRGIQNALQSEGYGLLLTTPGEALNRWVKSQAVDGVVLVGGGPTDYCAAAEIAEMGTPCVVIGHHPLPAVPNLASVMVGLRSGARQVAQMLLEQGHERIGFIGTQREDIVLTEFQEELEKLGMGLREDRVVIAGRALEDGATAMRELLSRPDPPTVVFARRDTLAFGALRAAKSMGLQVPGDVSIVGHDDVLFAQLVEPALTTVRVDCVELGRMASETLFALLNHPEIPARARVVNTELVVRDSAAPPSRSSF